jgi:hypothetical protein
MVMQQKAAAGRGSLEEGPKKKVSYKGVPDDLELTAQDAANGIGFINDQQLKRILTMGFRHVCGLEVGEIADATPEQKALVIKIVISSSPFYSMHALN